MCRKSSPFPSLLFLMAVLNKPGYFKLYLQDVFFISPATWTGFFHTVHWSWAQMVVFVHHVHRGSLTTAWGHCFAMENTFLSAPQVVMVLSMAAVTLGTCGHLASAWLSSGRWVTVISISGALHAFWINTFPSSSTFLILRVFLVTPWSSSCVGDAWQLCIFTYSDCMAFLVLLWYKCLCKLLWHLLYYPPWLDFYYFSTPQHILLFKVFYWLKFHFSSSL